MTVSDDIIAKGDPAASLFDLDRWNDTARPYPTDLTMHEMVERQVASRADAVAVAHPGGCLTYAALNARARDWAARLQQHGIGPGDRVGVHLDRTPELVAVLLGVLKSGAAYVPLDPSYPAARIEYMLADAAAAAVVTADERLTIAVPTTPALHPADTPVAARSFRRPRVAPEHPAYVLYTSGSTGQPKGVTLTHANAVDLLHWSAEVFADDLDQVLASTSICFDCSILEIFGPLTWGGTVVLADSVMEIATRPDAAGVRLLHSVPSVIDELLRSERLPAAVRTAIVGGEALWAGLVRQAYSRSAIKRFVNLYGPTECTSYATMSVATAESSATPPIGRPVANTRVYLVDSDLQRLPVGEPGEICIAGAGVTQGYLHRSRLTAERFLPDPFDGRGAGGTRMYRTGDLGQHDDAGELYFLGRIDEQVKIRGVRVEPVEVEQALLTHPGVREAAVTAAGDASGGVDLTAYVVADLDLSIGSDALRAFLRDRLPTPLLPSSYVFMQRLPRAPNGKLDRRRLPAPTPVVPCASSTTGRTASVLERYLAERWAEAIGISDVDIDADVFDLGAHSLPALQVRAKVAQTLGHELPIRLFFEQPTIAGQAAEISRMLGPGVTLPSGHGSNGVNPQPPPALASGVLSATQLAIVERVARRPTDAGLSAPLVIRLAGTLNLAALAGSLRSLQDRHRILTSTISTRPGGHPLWIVGRPAPVHFVDVSGFPAAEGVAHVVVSQLLGRRWRLDTEPPLRLAVVRIGQDDHVLCVGLHSVAADAWTIETVSHQILALYAAAIHGRAPDDGTEFIQYEQWAAERRSLRDSPGGAAHRRYWTERLAGLPVLRLPGDGHRSAHHSASAEQAFFTIPAATLRRLTALARAESVTPFMALLTAYAVLLHGRSGQDDIAIGAPTSGRLRPEQASVVGPCMDAFVVRCDLSEEPTFRTLLGRVRERALEAYANDGVPYVELAATWDDPARHPLFQASIVLQQRPSLLDPAYSAELAWRQPIGAVEPSGFLDEPPTTALDVELALFERDDELEGVLTCRTDVTGPADIELMAEAFVSIIDRVVADADISLAVLSGSSQGSLIS